jgi:hypothetical protein
MPGARSCSVFGRRSSSPPATSSLRVAAELCGKAEQLKAKYTIAETGVGAHISLLSGKAAADQHTLGASKSYTFESDYIFQPRVFMELQNAQAVALPYDGLNPLPPQCATSSRITSTRRPATSTTSLGGAVSSLTGFCRS